MLVADGVHKPHAVAATFLTRAATLWFATAAILTAVGVLHAYRVEGNDVRELFIWQAVPQSSGVVAYRAYPIMLAYTLATAVFALAAWRAGSTSSTNLNADDARHGAA